MIPKVIHYCWFGGGILPELAKKCIASWEKYCPHYQIKQWNESNYDISKNRYMHEAYMARKWGFVPDYARLDIIYEHGGFYFDTDVELIKPIDDLCNLPAFLGMENEGRIAAGLGFGAEPNNALILKMKEIYEDRVFINDYEFLSTHADPYYQTRLLRGLGLKENCEIQTIEGATIYPPEYFCPKNMLTGIEKITEKTYSIHHYDGSWAPSEVRDYNNFKWKAFNKYGKALGLLPWAFFVIRNFGIKELFAKIRRHI